jgi:UDP-N-acetylglucosamine--N-acetylmuramyl-(pentapeptide) pyrophosphoryl-undecaprenol N-acetylglucosamine transferase
MALVHKSAAQIVKDVDAGKDLVPLALNLLADKNKMATLATKIKSLGRVGATDAIVTEIEKLIAP